MVNTGSGGFEFFLVIIVLAVMAAGYYWLVVLPMRRDKELEDEWDDLDEWQEGNGRGPYHTE